MLLFRQFFRKDFKEFDPQIVKANLGGTCLQSKLKREKKITKQKN